MDTLRSLDDRELMRRVQDDDADAFELLYDRFARAAYHVARSICADTENANDALQDGFLAIWRSRASYSAERGTPRAWAIGVVRNRSIDTVRRNQRLQRQHADGEELLRRVPATGNVADAVTGQEQAQGLHGLLRKLPLAQREVIALAYFGGLTHTEISTQLALPAGTVKGRMRMALTKLRAGIDQGGSSAGTG